MYSTGQPIEALVNPIDALVNPIEALVNPEPALHCGHGSRQPAHRTSPAPPAAAAALPRPAAAATRLASTLHRSPHGRWWMTRQSIPWLQMCPFPEYTNIADGPYNMATQMCRTGVPPDLGPKGYIAHGAQKARSPAYPDSNRLCIQAKISYVSSFMDLDLQYIQTRSPVCPDSISCVSRLDPCAPRFVLAPTLPLWVRDHG